MTYETKSREELISELEALRGWVSKLQVEKPHKLSDKSHPSTENQINNPPLTNSFSELDQVPRPLTVTPDITESIELKSLFTRDVTTSGSFDVRGGIWATTFGKVIQALPIPAFLIDQDRNILVANQACGKFTSDYEKIQGQPYASLFEKSSTAEKALSLLERIFSDRKPRVGEGPIHINEVTLWARMTFRSIRIMQERFVLVLVEDLTREKIQLQENEKLRQELEKRVEQRTVELRNTNEELRHEVEERKRAVHERENVIVQLQQALAQVKKLSGLLPICASCKNIRDDQGYWQQIEAYIRDHSEADFSHGICPKCAKKLYPDLM